MSVKRSRDAASTPASGAVIARQPRDLTVAWAQRVLAAHARGATVASVALLAMDVGTTTRLQIAVEHDGPADVPRRWFVKLPSRSWRARAITALPRLLETEVRFYREIAPVLPITRPTALAAAHRFGRGTTLTLADVTEHGASVGSPADAVSAERACAVIDGLARLHARFWQSGRLDDAWAWLAGPVRRLEDRLGSALAVPLMRRGLRRAGTAIPTTLHVPALDYARQRRATMRLLGDGPRTLVHHDLHPGNLYWNEDRPGFLDWQLVRVGEGVGDVAYFLATSLTPETRRSHESELLERYRASLEAHGVADLDTGTLRRRYRMHLTYPFEAMVATLAVGGLMDRSANLALIRRTAAAVEDHDAFAFARAGAVGPPH